MCVSAQGVNPICPPYLLAAGVIFQMEIMKVNFQILSRWNIDPINATEVSWIVGRITRAPQCIISNRATS